MDEARVKRARLRAWRRGFREVDLILGPFADARLETMTAPQLASFERLLEVSDHDLYAWIVQDASPPAPYDDAVFADLKASAWSGDAMQRRRTTGRGGA